MVLSCSGCGNCLQQLQETHTCGSSLIPALDQMPFFYLGSTFRSPLSDSNKTPSFMLIATSSRKPSGTTLGTRSSPLSSAPLPQLVLLPN